MVKTMFFLHRRSDLSAEAFQRYSAASPEGHTALGDQANYLDMDRSHVLFMEENIIR